MTKANTPAGMKPRFDCDHPGNGKAAAAGCSRERAGLGVWL
jgi:hypothetical protein